MKKKNLLLVFVATIGLLVGMSNANAATVNSSVCKNGVVYTNYYYFLAAQGKDNSGSTYDSIYYGNNLKNNPYVTQGIYTNNIIALSGLTNFDNADSRYIISAVKEVPVTTKSSNGINNMNVIDFYENMIASRSYSNNAWTDSSTIGTKNVVSHIVKHAYWTSINNGQVSEYKTDGVGTNGYNARQLANASLQLKNTPTVSRLSNVGSNNITIQISRNYVGATPYYTKGYHYIVAKNASGKDIEWWLQPALAVIQYCEAKDSSSSNDNVVGLYTVTYDANTTDVVSNMPGNQVYYLNENYRVSTNVPTRNGYTFLGWSSDKYATAADPFYTAGNEISIRKDTTLYAIWKSNGTINPTPTSNNNSNNNLPSNPATGVEDYLLPIGGVVAASAVGLTLLKKKKSFLQF